MRLALGAMHRVYGDESLISDGPYPAAIIHSSVTEVTIQYPASQFLELKESQTFQVTSRLCRLIFFACCSN